MGRGDALLLMLPITEIRLKNCYGISRFAFVFDFVTLKAFCVYAPNGAMKTSLAKTLSDYSNKRESRDVMYPDRTSERVIVDDAGTPLDPDMFYVIHGYKGLDRSERIANILVNDELRREYEGIAEELDSEKKKLLLRLVQSSGIGRSELVLKSILDTFGTDDFFSILEPVGDEIADSLPQTFANFPYKVVFNESVIKFLERPGVRDKIDEYIKVYDGLIAGSPYLSKKFDHTRVSNVYKSLRDNGFFAANHSVNLTGETEVKNSLTDDQFKEIIDQEMGRVLADPSLRERFNEIDKALSNAALREFREFIFENQSMIPLLTDISDFRRRVWISFLAENGPFYSALLETYKKARARIEEIVAEARKQQDSWESVVSIFNERFSVPFRIKIDNQDDVILRQGVPRLQFVFRDSETAPESLTTKKDLLEVLSQGELRAFYILNIIFEVEARRLAKQPTVFVVDDIADSFDYRNKFAIVQYLRDISREDCFRLILLTHNFDFHRTVCGRLNLPKEAKLYAHRSETGVNFMPDRYGSTPFSLWKDKLHKDRTILIASIPFVRNLAEYSGQRKHFLKLTSLLHIKEDTDSILISDLELTLKAILTDRPVKSLVNPGKKVVDEIYECADDVCKGNLDLVDLERKIVLAIAIRLKAEEHMVTVFKADKTWAYPTRSQTQFLIYEYAAKFPDEVERLRFHDQVILMTPENIHLNSFMYEPILDMSLQDLAQLYKAACKGF